MEDIEIEEVDAQCEEDINDENVDKPEKKRRFQSGVWQFCETNRKKGDLKGQQVLAFEAKKEGDDQGGNLISVYFNKEACRLAIAKYAVVEELPFRHVEIEGSRS